MSRVDNPPARRGEGGCLLDLPRDTLVVKASRIVRGLAGVNGGDHACDPFIRLHTTTPRASRLPGSSGFDIHIVMTVNVSPSSLKNRSGSEPTHASVQATSTLVVHLSPSTR